MDLSTLLEPLDPPKGAARTFEGLTRLARSMRWDPETVVDWSRQPDLPEAQRSAWVAVFRTFHAGEERGLALIRTLGPRAAERFGDPSQAAYYETQADDEERHLVLFRRYLAKLGLDTPASPVVDWLARSAAFGPLAVERWILGAHFTESLAASVFQAALEGPLDPLGRDLVRLMLKDEARHLAGTRLALCRLGAALSRPVRALLSGWWRPFRTAAKLEVRRLGRHGRVVGLDPEAVLRAAQRRMAEAGTEWNL